MRVRDAVRERTKPRLGNRYVLATRAPRGSTFRAARALNNSALAASQESSPKKRVQSRAMLAGSGNTKHWPIRQAALPTRVRWANTFPVRPMKHRIARCACRVNTTARPEAVYVRERSVHPGPLEYSAQTRQLRLRAQIAHPGTTVIHKVKLSHVPCAASATSHGPARTAFRAQKTSTTTSQGPSNVWIVRPDL